MMILPIAWTNVTPFWLIWRYGQSYRYAIRRRRRWFLRRCHHRHRLCTVLLITWLMAVSSYLAHVCTYILHVHVCSSEIWLICPIWLAYLFHGTNMAVTCEGDMSKTLQYIGPFSMFSEIYLLPGNNICSVIYVKHMYCARYWMVNASDLKYGIYVCMCIHLSYKAIKYLT